MPDDCFRPRWTVAICSNGRTEIIPLVISGLRGQCRPDVQVVVVLGPDSPQDDLSTGLPPDITLVRTRERNLSVARNLAIRAAAGMFVAFLDDDAVPEPFWLDGIEAALEADAHVGGVGGPVFDHTGLGVQVRYNLVSRTGIPRPIMHRHDVASLYSSPDSWEVPSPLGANSAFRREALLDVGGFDEAFAYFLDESDLCLRLIDRGWALGVASSAWVHHKSAPSDVRNASRIVTDWSSILRSVAYFAYRHGGSEGRIIEDVGGFIAHARANVIANVASGGLAPTAADDLDAAIALEIASGRVAAQGDARVRDAGWFGVPGHSPVPRLMPRSPRRPDRVQVFILESEEHALQLLRASPSILRASLNNGSVVRLLVPTREGSRIDFENDVWMHRLSGDDGGFLDIAHAEVDRIRAFGPEVPFTVVDLRDSSWPAWA